MEQLLAAGTNHQYNALNLLVWPLKPVGKVDLC